MTKHTLYTKDTLSIIKVSPYTDAYLKEKKLLLIRSDINEKIILECSKSEIINEIYELLVKGISSKSEKYMQYFCEEPILKNWLELCIKKGVIE